MSNHNPNEKLEPRKSKVSVALAINHGLGGPKAMEKSAADGQTVNIPSQPHDHIQGTKERGRSALLVWHCWHEVCMAHRTRSQAKSERRFLCAIHTVCRQNVRFLPGELRRRAFREKLGKTNVWLPYRKPTQVDRARSPRGTSESSLRNSAKKRP
jgi:hypothetical protein